MKIRLIDHTGAGQLDPSDYAAKLLIYTKSTRLEQGEETQALVDEMDEKEIKSQLAYIANTVRSSWEFIDFTFEIRGVTRAFTHQLVRTRTASYAQQAQRVVDLSQGFGAMMPKVFEHNEPVREEWELLMEDIQEFYRLAVEDHGFSPQDARAALPTNVLTNIIVKMNLRTLVDLIGKRQNLRAQGEYGEVASGMLKLVTELMPWTVDFFSPDRKATPAIDAILRDLLGDDSPVQRNEINEALKELDKLKSTWG